MIIYLVKRLLWVIPIMWGVSTLVFSMIHLVPGDPVEIMLGETASIASRKQLEARLGLNRPLSVQYLDFLRSCLRGNLGDSIHSGRKVSRIISDHLPATLELSLGAMIIAILIALPAGIVSALKYNTLTDHSLMVFSLVGVSLPNFWLGPLFIIIFSIQFGWLPVSGRGSLKHLILPSITLGFSMAAILARMTRASLLDNLRQDYFRTATAKGRSRLGAIVRHSLKNAVIPVITITGLQLGSLLAGSIITEQIFAWPGIGRLTIQAINTRDYPLVQGCILTISLLYVLINLLTDISYALVDPRISLSADGQT
ncbi:MAG: nickel ABC transporter permease [bacterium]